MKIFNRHYGDGVEEAFGQMILESKQEKKQWKLMAGDPGKPSKFIMEDIMDIDIEQLPDKLKALKKNHEEDIEGIAASDLGEGKKMVYFIMRVLTSVFIKDIAKTEGISHIVPHPNDPSMLLVTFRVSE